MWSLGPQCDKTKAKLTSTFRSKLSAWFIKTFYVPIKNKEDVLKNSLYHIHEVVEQLNSEHLLNSTSNSVVASEFQVEAQKQTSSLSPFVCLWNFSKFNCNKARSRVRPCSTWWRIHGSRRHCSPGFPNDVTVILDDGFMRCVSLAQISD